MDERIEWMRMRRRASGGKDECKGKGGGQKVGRKEEKKTVQLRARAKEKGRKGRGGERL